MTYDYFTINFTAVTGELTYEVLINTADKALYDAKSSGRDCYVMQEV